MNGRGLAPVFIGEVVGRLLESPEANWFSFEDFAKTEWMMAMAAMIKKAMVNKHQSPNVNRYRVTTWFVDWPSEAIQHKSYVASYPYTPAPRAGMQMVAESAMGIPI